MSNTKITKKNLQYHLQKTKLMKSLIDVSIYTQDLFMQNMNYYLVTNLDSKINI